MSDDYPDVEGALRTWLRARPAVQGVVAQRVWFGIPKVDPVFPLVVVSRIGGTNAAGDAPVDEPLVQIDCWGDIHANGNGNKASALGVANVVRAELLDLVNDTTIAPGVRAAIASVDMAYSPDPDNDRPRYVLTVAGSFISA